MHSNTLWVCHCHHIVCLSSPVEPSLSCRYGVPAWDFVTGWCICGSHDKLHQSLHTTQQCLLTVSAFAICHHIVFLSSLVEPSLRCRFGAPVSDFATSSHSQTKVQGVPHITRRYIKEQITCYWFQYSLKHLKWWCLKVWGIVTWHESILLTLARDVKDHDLTVPNLSNHWPCT